MSEPSSVSTSPHTPVWLRRAAWRQACLIAILSIVVVSPAVAVDPSRLFTQYVHDNWTTNNGLPQDSVNAVVQTPDGYLWLATQEGLARFDGVRFTVFDSRTTHGVIGNFVYRVFVDRGGTLWVGGSGGLLRYEGNGTFVLFGSEHGWPDASARYISEDADGALWVGMGSEGSLGGKGLIRFKDGRVTNLTVRDGLPSNQVFQTVPDKAGNLWVGTAEGLAVLRSGRFRTYTTVDGLPDNFVRATFVDHAGQLWIGTSRGLARLDGGRFVTYSTKDGLSDDNIYAIYEDRDRVLWIATARGLNRMAAGKFESARSLTAVGDDLIFDVLEDREGSLWIGTHANGLHRLRAAKFSPFGSPEGLLGDSVSGILQDRSGRMWIGTSPGGVNVLDAGKLQTYSVKDGLSTGSARTFFEDPDGGMWIGTSDGLNRFQNGRITRYGAETGLPPATIQTVFRDRSGTLWVGTARGLMRWTGRTFELVVAQGGPISVRVIHEDRSGRLWIGGADGLGYFREGRFAPVTDQGLPQANVQSAFEEADGTLWFSTWGQGLRRFKNGKWSAITSQNGLYDDVAWAIVSDDHGNFWMGGNRGIYRVAKAQLDDVADHKRTMVTCVVYGTTDGMRKRETNAGSPATLRARDGRLWFATTAGVVVIDPEHIRSNRVVPPVVIEQFIADGKPVTPGRAAVLPAGTRTIELHFAGLSLLAPDRVRYRYRLEGFDEQWIDAGARRIAYYTNIAPGDYRFRVMAANDDGRWNETGATLSFHLAPYFHQTYWFYALVVIALILVGVGLDAWRERQKHIRHQVYHDPLTGLPNRSLLETRSKVALTQAGRRTRSVAILFLDLDGFKNVNDSLGHAAGDLLLQLVASRLRACIEEIDTLARIGGDEFAALLADLHDEKRAVEVAERMIAAMRQPFVVDSERLTLGISIGIALHPFDGREVKTILQAADRAMYRAKLAGGNSYQFNAADPSEDVLLT